MGITRRLEIAFLVLSSCFAQSILAADRPVFAEIRVIDAETKRGVPLVELESVDGVKYVTDNNGRIALAEPEWFGKEIFYTVRSPGYEVPKDGFGFRGVRVTPKLGKPIEIKLRRTMIAERLGRLTGAGFERDSELLGYLPLRPNSEHPGRVAGQDSVQAAVYMGKVFWFWGDTLKLDYPLGLFRTAGATTALPDAKDDFTGGFGYDYFTDPKTGFARAMMPLPERPEGVIWIFGVCTVPDAKGNDRLISHYSRRKNLETQLEQGIALFDDEKQIFEVAVKLDLKESWRKPSTNPIRHGEYLLFGASNPNVRVKATLEAVLDSKQYEAFTCAKADKPNELDLDETGRPRWRWQKELPPVNSKIERALVKEKKLKPEFARFLPADVATPATRIELHSGTVRWNEYRKRWVMVAGQIGGTASHLGEVWYAESTEPTGPFSTAVKILTHDKQTFYNVRHHEFLDRDGGRIIHFEGTYTNDFSGNPEKTPRYNYNQVLYRLDLNSPGLNSAMR